MPEPILLHLHTYYLNSSAPTKYYLLATINSILIVKEALFPIQIPGCEFIEKIGDILSLFLHPQSNIELGYCATSVVFFEWRKFLE